MRKILKSVKWSKLKHAYGSASNVPKTILELTSPDSAVRENAIWRLYGNIFHQGTRYEAAMFAIPFLGMLLEEEKVLDKHEIIYLLVNLAIGYDESFFPDGLNPVEYRQNLQHSKDNMLIEHRTAYRRYGAGPHVDLTCYNRVQKEVPKFIVNLTDDNKLVRCAASYALAWFPDEMEISIPGLKSHLISDPHPENLATTIISIGLVANNSLNYVDLKIFDNYLNHESALVRICAAISMAINLDRPTRIIVETLVEALQIAVDIQSTDQTIPFNEGNLAGLVSLVLVKCKQNSIDMIIPALCKALEVVGPYHSLDITQSILQIIIDNNSIALKDQDPRLLTPLQRQALQALANHGVWEIDGGMFVNYSNLVRAYGIPDGREKLLAYLNRP
ncbi:MAG: hypothetical protein OEZ02_10480 [Anaerolineae bacterium]|nr:hypothetical protein [Anaerolineae bacterium]